MSGYQRFIAYVYEYQKGRKTNNCGFLKVEVRNHTCTVEIRLQVKGMMPKESCQVYGFQRKDGLLGGILMGKCETRQDGIECIVKTDARNVGESKVAFGKLGGMILITESGGFFGTEWDDQAIRPDNFKELKLVPQEDKDKKAIKETEKKSEQENMPDSTEQSEQVVDSSENLSQESIDTSAELPGEKDLHIQSADNTGQKEPDLLSFGQQFCPFTDGDLAVCWKIQPQDLVHFPRRQCALRNNRFLQYGYYNFGHLLLCKRADGRYILGVPGSYDQQEQFMAGMFGFSCFKESSVIKVKKGRGGYWYRVIDSPVCS